MDISMKLFCLYHIFKSQMWTFHSGLLDKQFNGALSFSRGQFRGSHSLLWVRQCNVQQAGRFASRADEVKITCLDIMQNDWEGKKKQSRVIYNSITMPEWDCITKMPVITSAR